MNIPRNEEFRLVNDNKDVAISLEDSDEEKADLVFLDMRAEDRGFGWFINGSDPEGDYEMPIGAPFYFPTLEECAKDAIEFLQNHSKVTSLREWLPAVPLIEQFLSLNKGLSEK